MNVLPLPLLAATPARAEPSALTLSSRLLAALGRPVRYHLVTLGCPKNVVDSETFERRLQAAGCVAVATPDEADVLLANTCGFIEQSQEESITAILALSERQQARQSLIAAGCLVTLNRDDLRVELPEVDGLFDPTEWDGALTAVARHGLYRDATPEALAAAIEQIRAGSPPLRALDGLYEPHILAALRALPPLDPDALPATDGHGEALALLFDIPRAVPSGPRRVSAYLKISDGCNAPCTFCIIPQIKGRFTSAGAGALVAEATRLRAEGTRELVLVAQDSTAYGEDFGLRDALPDLLRMLAEAVPDTWLRLMYAYPGRVSERLIRTMAELPQVVKYLDVPLQHGSASTLKRMRRPANMAMVRRMVTDLRAAMPEIALRTSYIVGFPGETEAEFQELLDWVRETRFDHVGVFTYSRQERAVSHAFHGQVPEKVKRERRRRVMELQQEISLERHRALIGRELAVLIEGPARPDAARRRAGELLAGRSYRDAPDVDGTVLCQGEAAPGDLVRVRISGAMPYDLTGEIVGPADIDRPFSGGH